MVRNSVWAFHAGDIPKSAYFNLRRYHKADKLVDEIPTCVVDRLDNEMGFVVLSRPNAFAQFFKKCPEIEAGGIEN